MTTTGSSGVAGGLRALDVLRALPVFPVLVANGYLAVLTVAAMRRRGMDGGAGAPAGHRANRIVVLVPAHDEERNVGRTIDSVLSQAYPDHMVAVHVVADNCTDRTAEVARRHGAEVHERFDPASPGKGPALAWLLERLSARSEPIDAVVVVDADTSMRAGFLEVVDDALRGQGSVWQAYYTVRDPDSSASVAVRTAALALRHYVRPLGRVALGASSGLYGNGMVFRPEVLRDRVFSAHLTEDVEFQLELLLDDELVGFLPTAVVEAEMPTTFEAAQSQNERWERGRLDLARRYIPRLLRRSVQARVTRRLALVDGVLDQLVPPLSVLVALTAVATTGSAGLSLVGDARRWRVAMVFAAAASAGLGFHVVGGLSVAGSPGQSYRILIHAPRAVIWKVRLWIRMLVGPEEVAWTRTARNDLTPVPGGPTTLGPRGE